MPSKQKALFIAEKQGDFVIGENDIPTPGPGDVLVKIQATSLNPIDWKIKKMGIIVQDYPAIVGTDIAGDVVEVGEGVTNFKKGDRVFTYSWFANDRASFQQYAIVDTARLAHIPANYSYDDIAALPVVLTAAYLGLYNQPPHGLGIDPPLTEEARTKYAGQPIAILGGGSSVGHAAIQLAKYSGFSPIIATASLKHEEKLKSLGATHVFDRNLSAEALADEVKKITDKPLLFVYDTVSSPETQHIGYTILSPGGRIELVLGPFVEKYAIKTPEGKFRSNVIGFPHIPENKSLIDQLFREKASEWVEKGIVKPNKVEVLPNGLLGIIDGLKRLELDQVSGVKLVARPQETP